MNVNFGNNNSSFIKYTTPSGIKSIINADQVKEFSNAASRSSYFVINKKNNIIGYANKEKVHKNIIDVSA